ncbi:hypothetical protein CPB83DRAFT_893540 [Crepidotus variabilis]|uniref:Uncharacterized protein n=1 Tax=Crepidotus variabilis TaxID=179855 RepID=A0A9P6EIC7_9AGAR|nr:hypothetical protein CPB83DRAFT_893540 [Crepidotus variabilis]
MSNANRSSTRLAGKPRQVVPGAKRPASSKESSRTSSNSSSNSNTSTRFSSGRTGLSDREKQRLARVREAQRKELQGKQAQASREENRRMRDTEQDVDGEQDEPSVVSTSAYVSAPTFELPEIPSENQLNRSVLLSLKLGEDDDSKNKSKRSFTICVGVFRVVTRGNATTAFSTCIVGCYPPAITNSDTITLVGVYQFDVQAAATFRNPIIGKFPAVPEFTYSPARSPAEISRSLASSPSLPPLPLSPSLPSSRSSPPSSHPSTPPTSLPISTLGRTLIVMPMSTVLSSASSLPASTQVVHPTTAALSQSTWSILDFTPAR